MRLLRTALHTFASYAQFAAVSLRASANRTRASRAESADRRNSLLFVTWSFPPHVSGGIYRPAALCRYAHESGRQVTVVAGPAPGRPSPAGLKMLEYLPSAVRIVRARPPRWKPSYSGFPRVDGGLLSALDMATAAWDASPPISPGA